MRHLAPIIPAAIVVALAALAGLLLFVPDAILTGLLP